ncbi:MAG TPA: VWA domain-containing protein [Pyrinomonadaceae bacterium]|nr:VWA domain-containing protein [Pyrinomonadaceae bacterium]
MTRPERVTHQPTRAPRGRLASAPCTLACALALLLPAASGAQSGRVKKGDDAPRRTTPARATRPAPSATPLIEEATPPPPTPRPKWMAPAATPTPSVTLPAQSAPLPTPSPTPRETSIASGDRGAREDGEDEVVKITSNLVPIPATVVDARGLPVLDLELKDFELEVDGVARPLGDLHRSDTPVVLAMLFDNSSSLRAAREFEKRAAVQFFRSVMRPVDRGAVYSVSTIPHLAHPLTGDVRALVRTIEGFDKPEGATALLDGVWRASEYLRPHPGRRVIVIVSDGVDTISDMSFEEVLQRAVAAHCQIYIVQTGHSDNVNLLDLAARRRMQDFAAQTGGAVYAPTSNAELSDAFAQIAADLSQQYVLSYYPSEDRRDGRFHAVSLRVNTRPNLRVRTRKGYYAPKG